MDFVFELLISLLVVIGGVFGLVGSYGLSKLDNLMARLHGPTKATTVGVGSVLIASMLYFAWFQGDLSVHELLITLFLFLTAPITANFIAKAYLHRRAQPEELPPPQGQEIGWASFQAPPETPADEPDSMEAPRPDKGQA